MNWKLKVFLSLYELTLNIRRVIGKVLFCIGWFFMYYSSIVFPEIEHFYSQKRHKTKPSKFTKYIVGLLK